VQATAGAKREGKKDLRRKFRKVKNGKKYQQRKKIKGLIFEGG
jgi:hypothetical protein